MAAGSRFRGSEFKVNETSNRRMSKEGIAVYFNKIKRNLLRA
jgi:hypothetical protein